MEQKAAEEGKIISEQQKPEYLKLPVQVIRKIGVMEKTSFLKICHGVLNCRKFKTENFLDKFSNHETES